MAALAAKGVPRVPVEKGARLGVDGSFGGGQGHVCTALEELETGLLFVCDEAAELGGCFGRAAAGGEVEGEVWRAFVDCPFETIRDAFVQAEEEELGDGDSGVVGGDQVGFGFGVGVFGE